MPTLDELAFIHITKTAGTSIERWGEAHGIKWAHKNKGYLDKCSRQRYKQCCSWHVPPSCFDTNPYEHKRTFTVVRNPYTRLISEFYCPWTGHKTDYYLQTSHSKEGLNRWIQHLMRTDTVNGKPQYAYLPVDHVLKFETLQKDFTDLILAYGSMSQHDTMLPTCNQAPNKVFTVEDLTNETVQLINARYDNDFAHFHYKKKKYLLLTPFVINLKRRPDRLKVFQSTCPIVNVEVVEAFDAKHRDDVSPRFKSMEYVGEKGCWMSHLAIWKRVVAEKVSFALVFEDDVRFYSDFKTNWTKIQEQMHQINDLDILYLGGRDKDVVFQHYIPVAKHIVKHDTTHAWDDHDMSRGTFSYVLSNSGAKKLLDQLDRPIPCISGGKWYNFYNLPVDHYMMNVFLHKGTVHTVAPYLCYSDGNDSDIR